MKKSDWLLLALHTDIRLLKHGFLLQHRIRGQVGTHYVQSDCRTALPAERRPSRDAS